MVNTPPPLELGRNPTPENESDDFSTPDEKADARAKNHELEKLTREQGPIGKLIGCSDSSLTIAFFLLAFGGVAILATIIGMMIEPPAFSGVLEKILTFELTIAGYVMGKKAS